MLLGIMKEVERAFAIDLFILNVTGYLTRGKSLVGQCHVVFRRDLWNFSNAVYSSPWAM